MTLDDLYRALRMNWCKETAYRADRSNWSIEKKSTGQCTVTAMIVFDYFGGTIVRGYSQQYDLFHYWNVIDGEKIDLTFDQFLDNKADITFTRTVIKTKRELMNISSVRKRYLLLKRKVDQYLNTV